MSKPSHRAFLPSLSSLEGRIVLSTAGAALTSSGPVAGVIATPADPPPFDTTLSASFGRYSDGSAFLFVDGSDYDDTIQVLNYSPGSSITLTLESRLNGVLLSSRTVRYHSNFSVTSPPLSISARGGRDTIINGTAASMYAFGGAGDDWIYGSSAADFIYAEAGNDTVYGIGGNDWLDGGEGADNLSGGSGNDTLYGMSGADRLDGEAGNDVLIGADGDDSLFGGDGDDYLDGGSGNDYADGGAGADSLFGGTGNDSLYGGSGADHLDGGDGDDWLFGDAGNDTLSGQGGYDHLYGGDGNDRLDAGYRIGGSIDYGEYLQGGAGADTFVRHKSAFGFDDLDLFVDYNSAQGDSVDNDWHW